MSHLTVELSCGPATPVRTNNRHCTGLTESAAQRAARQLERVVRRQGENVYGKDGIGLRPSAVRRTF